MKSLEQLKDEILADGRIDASEVKELQEILFADGKIDSKEAELLFDLNNAVSGKDNDPGWEALFIKALADYLLADENSTGEIDEQEANWLYNQIKGDGQIDDVEKKLLIYLKNNSKNFPANLSGFLN